MDDGVKEEVGFAVSCVADKFWSRKSKCPEQGRLKKQSKKQFPVQLLFRFRGSSELRVGSIFGTILGSLHGWPELGPTSRFPTKQETQNRPGGTQFWFQKWNHFKNKIGFFFKTQTNPLSKNRYGFCGLFPYSRSSTSLQSKLLKQVCMQVT